MANLIYSSLESWKSSDFNTILKDLDTVASDIANEKDQSDASRRVLIEKNKKFKEQVSLDTRKEVGPLLKSFQTEVDSLNKRNKNLETYLLTIYKKLIDLPDPSNALELAMKNQKKLQKSQDIALENKKLRETLEEYQLEFSSVKNQEVTIKQLRDKIKDLESNMAATIDGKSKDIERDFGNTFAEKERDLVKEKMEMIHKFTECENKLAVTEKNLLDSQSELFQMKNRFDDFSAAKTSEIEILISENERNVERLRLLESLSPKDEIDKDEFIFQAKSNKRNEVKTNEISDLQMDLNSKDVEISKLNEELRSVNARFTQNEKRYLGQIDDLKNELSENQSIIMQLRGDLESQSDYTEIKKELHIVRSIEFQHFETSQNEIDGPPSLQSRDSYVHTKSIEQLLNDKNRHLENKLLQMTASYSHIQVEMKNLQEEYDENLLKLNEQYQLINQLEDDLRNVKSFQSTGKLGEFSNESSEISFKESGAQVIKVNEANILADVLEQNDEKANNLGPNSLLTIVQSQRDRYRIRSQELEASSQAYQQTIQNLQLENERIGIDNVKLYEKVRFLQSYSRSTKNTFDDSTMSRYSVEYEANLNPFETFNRRERQRQFQALPPHEKIVLSLGQFVMGNRTARLVAFLYSLLLHFLIFIVLYKLAYTETCVRDQAFQCRKEFADHMKSAHGK